MSNEAALAEQVEPPSKGLALVVDDDATNLLYLQMQLEMENYDVITAANGEQAVRQYEVSLPDIVFMDVMMPVMDGYEAARRIKEMAGERFVPMIFLTAMSEDEALVRSVDAGGDDFLTKPYKRNILRAKIHAIERTRLLYERIRAQHAELNLLHGRVQREQEIAEQILSGAIAAHNVANEHVRTMLRPAATFNGDLLISAYTPSGALCLLMGDFTGHGLAAAIGALPVSEVFRAMTGKGFDLVDVVAEINRKLYRLLPTGMFMATCAVRLEPGTGTAEVWNSGMPDVVVRDAHSRKIKRLVPSQHPPLGALPTILSGCNPEMLPLSEEDALVICSDGVIEACNATGLVFGEARLKAAVTEAPALLCFDAVAGALEAFVGDTPQDDDVSLAVITYSAALFPASVRTAPRVSVEAHPASWHWEVKLTGQHLAEIDPVPLAMSQISAFRTVEPWRQQLFVVLTELFSNGLEHGVLALDSAQKHSADGFAAYYAARQERLAALQDGWVRIELDYGACESRGYVRICVEDSGPGFDHEPWTRVSVAENHTPSGRGIALLRSMCMSLRFVGTGNRVEAVFAL